jgi:hypothetical protein
MDTVEIEPLVAKAARIGFMPRVERAFNDPRSHLYFEDAKTFFAVNRKKYDVIVSEPSNPWVSGVSSLFSEEFYDQITRYLEPDGMLVQWIQTYETDMDIVMSIVKALDSHFTDFAIYNTDSTNLLVVAVRQGNVRAIDPRIFATAALRAELERVGVESTQDIRSRFLGDRKLIAPLARAYGVPANSDYFPYVDLTAPRARVLKHNAIEFTGLQTLSVPFFELLDGSPDPRDATSPSDNPVTPRDYLTQQAVAIRDAILTSRYDGLWPDDVRMISTLRSSKEQCTDPAIRGAWLSSAVYVAEKTNSPLGAREASKLWDNLANTPCAQLLEGSDRNLFSLLQAVARRDAASVSSLGSGLLADAHSLSEPDQKLFAVLATAAGAISLNQPRAALDVIAKQGDRVPQNATVLLALKWLTALAAEESNAARAEVARSERGS